MTSCLVSFSVTVFNVFNVFNVFVMFVVFLVMSSFGSYVFWAAFVINKTLQATSCSEFVTACYDEYLLFDFDSVLAQGRYFESKGDKLSSSAECMIPTLAIEDQAMKNPLVHNSPSLWWVSSEPTCLHCRIGSPVAWRHAYLLFDFDSALVHGGDFESKGGKLCSFPECRIRTLEVWNTKSPADWISIHKPAELSKIMLTKLELSTARPYDEYKRQISQITWLFELDCRCCFNIYHTLIYWIHLTHYTPHITPTNPP